MNRGTLYFVGVLLALYLPIASIVIYSFNDAKYAQTWMGFTLKWYENLWDQSPLVTALVHSLILALTASFLTVGFGGLAALYLYRCNFPGKQLVQGMLYTLCMTPDIVMAVSLLTIFVVLGFDLGFTTLLIAHITFALPFVIATIDARLRGFDPNLWAAACDLGANEWQIISRIICPMLMPALISSFLLTFTLSLDDVVVSFFVTGPEFEIFPVKVYSLVRLGFRPEVNALASLMVVFSLAIAFAGQRYFDAVLARKNA